MKAKRKIRGNEFIIMHKKVVVAKIVKYWDKIWQNLHTKKIKKWFNGIENTKDLTWEGDPPLGSWVVICKAYKRWPFHILSYPTRGK